MEDNYFTVFWWFLPYISMNQPRVHKGVEKREPPYTVGGNANRYSHCGEQGADSVKNWK